MTVKELPFSIEEQMGFEFPGFDILDGMVDGGGFCYYDTAGNCFYTCYSSLTRDWWNEESMNIICECPFCDTSVGGFTDSERSYVKHYMGLHLARLHRVEVEQALIQKEARDEYTAFYC
jgi:hypothetical protein